MAYNSLQDFVQVLQQAGELKRVSHPAQSPQVRPPFWSIDDIYWFRIRATDLSAGSIIDIQSLDKSAKAHKIERFIGLAVFHRAPWQDCCARLHNPAECEGPHGNTRSLRRVGLAPRLLGPNCGRLPHNRGEA